MFALVVIGPPGAGKTSVLAALSEALVLDDIHHAAVEMEALTSMHPALDRERWFAPLRAVCALYRQFDCEVVLVTATVEDETDLRGVLAAVGADEHVVVSLAAEPATLRRRIIEREPERWTGLDALLATAARLGPAVACLDGVALALSTEGQLPQMIARRIREAHPATLQPAS